MFERWVSDRRLQKWYEDAGATIGNALSYSYMGEPLGLKGLFTRWEKFEAEYSKRGYRTISLDAFIRLGGYGIPLPDIGVRRELEEVPVLHAKIFRAEYYQNDRLTIEPASISWEGDMFTGTYTLPTTERE